MTTGRINQITIVRRGKTATGAASSAGEMSKFTGWRPETRRAKHLRREPWAPCEPAIRFPTRVFPSEAVDRTVPERAACGLGLARRRTQRPPSAIAASGGRGCLPLLDGRTRQRPVIHRTHPYGGDCRGIRRLQGIPSTP